MRKILVAVLALIFIFVFSIYMISLILPPVYGIHMGHVFERYTYFNETEGPEEEKSLFNNFEFNSQDSLKINPKFPDVNVGEKYVYEYYSPKNCFSSESGAAHCYNEKRYNISFRVLNVTGNKIKYSGYWEDEIVFPSEENFSSVFKDSYDCGYFICKWFSYVNGNLSSGLKFKVTNDDEELKNVEIFNEYILFSSSSENVNGRDCLKVEVYKKTDSGIRSTCQGILLLFLNCNNVTIEYRISKEIFWVDADKRILVRMQIWNNGKILKETNLINITKY